MPTLTILRGPGSGTEMSFDKSVLIGRGPMADLTLKDPTISRRHAQLSWIGRECFVADLDSENGTYLNGKRIGEPTRLSDGDVITVGTVVVEYRHDDGGPAVGEESSIRFVESAASESQILMRVGTDEESIEGLAEADRGGPTRLLTERLRFLNSLAETIGQTFDRSVLLSFVLDQVFELMPQTERAFVMLWDDDEDRFEPMGARTRSGEATRIDVSRTLLDDVRQRREGILVVQSLEDRRYAQAASMHAIGIRSAICAPIIFHDEFYGVVQVDCSYTGKPFEKLDMALMMAVASQVAMFLGTTKLHEQLVERQLIEHDMLLARRIQQHFLPEGSPAAAGWSFAVDYSPALAIGGDFYDFLELADGRIGLMVGDVSGKGVSAALYGAKLSAEVRYHSVGQSQPAEILRRVNRGLSGESGMFVTCVLVALDTRTGQLRLASAGHLQPIVRRRGGTMAALGQPGDPPLGLAPDSAFHQVDDRLESGDVMVLYTDGVNEAENEASELFGNERLQQVIAGGRGAEGILTAVLSSIKKFAGEAPQSDDITVVCVGRG